MVMESYNYNAEILTNLKMFESAFDDTIIKRFDGRTGAVRDNIKVNYVYGPKSRILTDIQGKPDTVKFPIVAITPKGYSRDNERVKNKIQDHVYESHDGYINLRPIPFNISLEMTILGKYFEDVDQIIQNFLVYTNPYIVYSVKEPKTGRELRIEVLCDGNVNLNYPGADGELPPTAAFRTYATINFTIKTYLFRTNLTPVKPICFIYDDIIVTDNFYCNYDTLTAHTSGNGMQDNYLLEGRPKIQFVKPYFVETSTQPTIKIQGDGFLNTTALVLSSNNPLMFGSNASGTYTGTNLEIKHGYLVENFNIHNPRELSFTCPSPSATGKFDIIAFNSCGYGQLTVDADRSERDINPYPTSHPSYSSWEVLQYPYLSGVTVYGSNFISCSA
jgi:hypothetical protein